MFQKFYRTLSEIKGEVESIIKTGRKMVEERYVGEPQELSRQIDHLKELYNRLGAQVTDSKGRLESALLLAREIQNDLHSLTGWLDGHSAGTVGRQALELEMSRMQAVKDKLDANYAEYAAACEPARLQPLRRQLEEVDARWRRLRRPDPAPAPAAAEPLLLQLRGAERLLQARPEPAPAQLQALAAELRAAPPPGDAALRRLWEDVLHKVEVSATTVLWEASF